MKKPERSTITGPPKHILIIENDPDDAFLIRHAFGSVPECGTCSVCRNLSEAKAYLGGAGMYADRHAFPIPRAVISDLRMEGDSGLDLLSWMKHQPDLINIPVIILTSSASQDEWNAAVELGAQVERKPHELDELRKLLLSLTTRICRGSN